MSHPPHGPKEETESHEGTGRDHRHPPRRLARRRLWIVIVITLATMAVEAVGGLLTNSLSLLSDAFHMLTHAAALSVSLLSIVIAAKAASRVKTFGYWRAEVLSALFNGLALLPILAYIVYEAYDKLVHPEPIRELPMLVVAVVGLIVNLACAAILGGAAGKGDLNLRGAFLHLLGDTASSVGVILAAVTIHYTGWLWLDPAVSVLIALVILVWSVGLIRESSHILLEGVPREVELDAVEEAIRGIEGVEGLHDLHVWQITHKMYALTAHLEVCADFGLYRCAGITARAREILDRRFDIRHVTLEVEPTGGA